MRRIRGPHTDAGFTGIGLVVMVTILALVAGVLTDIVIVSLRKPPPSKSTLAPVEAELTIARFLSKDVLPSFTAAPAATACGVTHAALVMTEKSVPTLARADQAVAYSIGPGGLTRSTCAAGATSATTTTLVSPETVEFVVSCKSPGTCGTVHVEGATLTSTDTTAHHFSLDVTRRLNQK